MAKHLDTDKKYIKDLFSPDFFYNIPEYQRPYVWESEQVIALIEDISNALEKDEKKEYFLGCMVWNTKKEVKNSINYTYQDILDGQQRFITLYLLLAVIRDFSNDEQMKQTINEQLKQHENKYKNIPERHRIEFEIRDDDDFLEKYVVTPNGTLSDQLQNESKNKNNSRSVRRMASAITYMRKWWDEKKLEDTNIQEKIQSFFMYLCNKVLILYLATPDNLDDAYNLFTILNSRGLKLQPSDILKAQNLRLISNEKVRKKYAEEWADYEDQFGPPFFATFDAFLWSLVEIKMKYRSDENMSLALAFDHMHKKQSVEKGEGLFLLVEKYIEHYQTILNWKDNNEEKHNYFQNIVTILSSTSTTKFMTPLMHYLECFGDYRITEYLIKLDNLISVMWITGKRDSETRIFIILRKMDELLDKYKNHSNHKFIAADEFINSDVLKYEYMHQGANTAINIEDFFSTLDLENWGSFSGSRINKVKYILLKLDLIYGNRNTKIGYQHQNSSLEHILPKTIANTIWNISNTDHEKWCHRLGNLVLLDRRKNVSISNSTYAIKKQKYSDSVESRAYTNKLFINYNSWNIQDLIQNHNNVVSLLKRYYIGNSLDTLLHFHNK